MNIRRAVAEDCEALTALALRAKAHWGYTANQLERWRPLLTISRVTLAARPTFVTNVVDETAFFAQTSAVCGFPVYEHDTGTVTSMVTTLPDGSVKSHDVVVKITATFFSTDPNHPRCADQGLAGMIRDQLTTTSP